MLKYLSLVVPIFVAMSVTFSSRLNTQARDECGCCSCPNGWVYFEGSCYLFGDDDPKYSWTEATQHCATHHSHLVVINNAREDIFIKGFLKRLIRNEGDRDSNPFWTGATDEVSEGLWTWYTDDSSLGYTNWYPGQPGSNGHDEDCLCLLHSNYDWHDCSCSDKFHAICEISLRDRSDDIIG